MTEHYMRLLTDVELNDRQKHVWHRAVEKFLGAEYSTQPENFLDTLTSQRDEFKGDANFPYVYVVYLSDDVDPIIAEQIVVLWSEIYPRDFEIESSADFDPDNCDCNSGECVCDVEIDDDLHEEIQRRASKFLHNRWVERQISEGWRYGMQKSSDRQTNPRLRDWDNLREEYRREISMTRDQAVKFFKQYPHLFV